MACQRPFDQTIGVVDAEKTGIELSNRLKGASEPVLIGCLYAEGRQEWSGQYNNAIQTRDYVNPDGSYEQWIGLAHETGDSTYLGGYSVRYDQYGWPVGGTLLEWRKL